MAAWVSASTDALYRLFLGTRPFDWLMFGVDVSVLIVSTVVLIFSWPVWRREHKGKKMVAELLLFSDRGNELKASVPYLPGSGQEVQQRWLENVRAWDTETQRGIASHSSLALSAFNQIVHLRETDRAVITTHGDLYPISGPFGDAYQKLQAKLDNLQRITEKPEVYF